MKNKEERRKTKERKSDTIFSPSFIKKKKERKKDEREKTIITLFMSFCATLSRLVIFIYLRSIVHQTSGISLWRSAKEKKGEDGIIKLKRDFCIIVICEYVLVCSTDRVQFPSYPSVHGSLSELETIHSLAAE